MELGGDMRKKFDPISQELNFEESSFGFWRAQVVVWAVLGLIGFCIRYVFFGSGMAAAWLTLALEPIAFALTSGAALMHVRFFHRRSSFFPTLASAALLCLAAAAFVSAIGQLIHQLFPPGTVRVLPGNQYRIGFIYYMGIFSIWTLTYFGVNAELAARNERLSKMKAETRAVQLELEHLQRQIEPHFLFNSLNAIVAEISERPAIAEEMTRRLADYLRYSLDKSGGHLCSLAEELDAAETYVRIQALRFDKQLEYQSQVDPAALDMRLPHMTLQGLVENAIKHGMSADHASFLVTVKVTYKDEELVIEVSNPGRLHAPSGLAPGNGLSNLCRRLALYYPDRYEFSLHERAGQTVAQIKLRGAPHMPF